MKRCVLALSLVLVALAACDESTTAPEPPPLSLDAQLRQLIGGWGVVPIGGMPQQDPALVALGRALFFDRVLSGNRDISCATCHHPATSLGDALPLAVGTGGTGTGTGRTPGPGRDFVSRGALSLLNSGLGLPYMFWDGRLSGFGFGTVHVEDGPVPPAGVSNVLVAQAMLPVVTRAEMLGNAGDTDVFGHPNELAAFGPGQETEIWRAIMQRLLAYPEYVALFGAAFPGRPASTLRFEDAALALATFQRQAFTKTRSPFDRYLDRDDAALTTAQKRGALLFFGPAQCGSCHSGPFLGGQTFANVGAPQIGPGGRKEPPLDLGRGEVQDNDFYRFSFRAPPLRNVELTAPYMHSGAYSTLEAVVEHYNDVPTALRSYDVLVHAPALAGSHHGDDATVDAVLATLDHRLRAPLDLTDEQMQDLVAFLKSLTDPAARDLSALVPATVPSGLPVQ
ncbi:MAG TPA: cytochrome c peroxidase [Longimicrobiales bacterium]